MLKDELYVGQTVFMKPIGNNARYDKEIKKGKITKIGRKFFYVLEERFWSRPDELGSKISLETKRQDGDFASWQIYLSEREVLDENEFQELSRRLKSEFSSYGRLDFSLDQLRRIVAIVEESNKNNIES